MNKSIPPCKLFLFEPNNMFHADRTSMILRIILDFSSVSLLLLIVVQAFSQGFRVHHHSFFLASFPLNVFGRESQNSTYFGIMKGSRLFLQCLRIIFSVNASSLLQTIIAFMAWPRISSGTPIATTSPMLFNSCKVFSISLGLTLSPLVFIKSSLLAIK